MLVIFSTIPGTSSNTIPLQPSLQQREGFFNKTSYVRLFSPISLYHHIGLSFRSCVGGQLFLQRSQNCTISLEVYKEGLIFSVTLYYPTRHYNSQISANFLNNAWQTVNILYRLGNLTIFAAGHQQVCIIQLNNFILIKLLYLFENVIYNFLVSFSIVLLLKYRIIFI